jgi:hypothetical protein
MCHPLQDCGPTASNISWRAKPLCFTSVRQTGQEASFRVGLARCGESFFRMSSPRCTPQLQRDSMLLPSPILLRSAHECPASSPSPAGSVEPGHGRALQYRTQEQYGKVLRSRRLGAAIRWPDITQYWHRLGALVINICSSRNGLLHLHLSPRPWPDIKAQPFGFRGGVGGTRWAGLGGAGHAVRISGEASAAYFYYT